MDGESQKQKGLGNEFVSFGQSYFDNHLKRAKTKRENDGPNS